MLGWKKDAREKRAMPSVLVKTTPLWDKQYRSSIMRDIKGKRHACMPSSIKGSQREGIFIHRQRESVMHHRANRFFFQGAVLPFSSFFRVDDIHDDLPSSLCRVDASSSLCLLLHACLPLSYNVLHNNNCCGIVLSILTEATSSCLDKTKQGIASPQA